MTTEQFIAKQNKKLSQIVKNDIPLKLAAYTVMAMQSKRIFFLAQNSTYGIIGKYGDKELYVNPKNSPKKFPTKGKTGKSTFDTYHGFKVSGKKHKTGYFPNYLTFKKKIGQNKNTSNVNLMLWGHLSQNWANGKLSAAKPTKVNPHK